MKLKVQGRGGEMLFCLSLIAYYTSQMLERSAWAVRPDGSLTGFALLLKGMRYAAYAIALVKILCIGRYRRDSFLCIGLSVLVVAGSMLCSGSRTLFLSFVIFIAAYGVPPERVIKLAFVPQLLLSCAILLSAAIGVIPDYIWPSTDRVRHFLGFSWVTTAPGMFEFLVYEYLFLKKGRISIWEYAIFMSVDVVLFKLTDTRAPFILSAFALTFFLVYQELFAKGRLLKKVNLLVTLLPFVLSGLAIWAACSYDPSNTVWQGLDTLLSSRLSLSQRAMSDYGVTLLGQQIEWEGNGLSDLLYGRTQAYNYVDSSYLQILFQYGILTLILVLFAYAFMLRGSIVRGEYYFTWILILILAHSVMDPSLLNLPFNPFILICACEMGTLRSDRASCKNVPGIEGWKLVKSIE